MVITLLGTRTRLHEKTCGQTDRETKNNFLIFTNHSVVTLIVFIFSFHIPDYTYLSFILFYLIFIFCLVPHPSVLSFFSHTHLLVLPSCIHFPRLNSAPSSLFAPHYLSATHITVGVFSHCHVIIQVSFFCPFDSLL